MSATRTQPPSPWPDKPLIRVVSGYESGIGLVNGALAIRDTSGCYRLLGGGLLVPQTGDVIETWEEMVAVPVCQASYIAVDEAPERADGQARPLTCPAPYDGIH